MQENQANAADVKAYANIMLQHFSNTLLLCTEGEGYDTKHKSFAEDFKTFHTTLHSSQTEVEINLDSELFDWHGGDPVKGDKLRNKQMVKPDSSLKLEKSEVKHIENLKEDLTEVISDSIGKMIKGNQEQLCYDSPSIRGWLEQLPQVTLLKLKLAMGGGECLEKLVGSDIAEAV